jgi:hypothetical protein
MIPTEFQQKILERLDKIIRLMEGPAKAPSLSLVTPIPKKRGRPKKEGV